MENKTDIEEFNALENIIIDNDLVKDSPKNNRYSNIRPYKFNNDLNMGNDYINASEMKLQYCDFSFLVTQHPLESSVSNFWKMVGENKVKLIIMLNQFDNDHKSYFPQKIGKSLNFQFFVVTLESSIIENAVRRTVLNVEYKGNKWTILHLQLITWMDLKSPKEADLRELLSSFNHILSKMKKDEKIVLHCSAGVGRSGVFLAAIEMEHYFLKYESLEKFSVIECIKNLRKQRMNMVNTLNQYVFLKEYQKKFLKYYLSTFPPQ
jgi:protein tyrosine phosphatase